MSPIAEKPRRRPSSRKPGNERLRDPKKSAAPARRSARQEPPPAPASLTEKLQALAKVFTSRPSADTLDDADPVLVEATEPIVRALELYFRAEVTGLERVPEGHALLVGNHNAGITFLEPFFLGRAWFKHTGGRDMLRFLGHDIMVSMPLVGSLLVRAGVIRAAHEMANRALADGHKVVVFPGGNYEAFRPYAQRHLVDFGGKTGFVRLALRNRVPIVPVLSTGGHSTFFVLHRGEWLARVTGTRKYLRSESFPIFLGLPWGVGVGPIFHLPLPAKLRVEIGEPMSLAPYGPRDADDPEVCEKLSREVQDRLQKMMDDQRRRLGR